MTEALPVFGFDTDDTMSVTLYRDTRHAVGALCLPDLEDGLMVYYLTNGHRLDTVFPASARGGTPTLVPDARGPQLDELCQRLIEWFDRSGRPLRTTNPGRALVREAIDRAEITR
jgi:hypothetical protein